MKNIYLIFTIVILSLILLTTTFTKNDVKEEQITNKIYIKINNGELYLEEYVIGVVAAEMPASFELEALKAQAVASRTYAYNKYLDEIIMTGTINDQVYINEIQMKEKWGSDFELYYNKIKQAVNDTKDEIITYNNEPIIAYYFSMSNGTTENSQSVFNETHPYLNSVESTWETTHESFQETITYTEEEICSLLNQDCTTIEIRNIIYSNTNRIETIEINNIIYEGTEFRHLLNLRSTDINISKTDNIINFTTNGYGHGVGMSQYGANGLAKENKTYQEILKYYYQDTEINKIIV